MDRAALSLVEESSFKAVESRKLGAHFVRPAYQDYCFSNFPGFFEELLLGATERPSLPDNVVQALGTWDHVIFIFVDSFGWQTYERLRPTAALLSNHRFQQVVLKVTAQFPSTTAAHVTTILSGLPAYEHYICGWDYFEPKVGRMIKPLPLSFSEDDEPGTIVRAGFESHDILPPGIFIPKLLTNGVSVNLYGPQKIYPSPFVLRYASRDHIVGYLTLEQGFSDLSKKLQKARAKSFSMFYIDLYDRVSHKYGVISENADQVALQILNQCDNFFQTSFPARTLVCLSADHGQISDRPGGGVAINHIIPNLGYLKHDSLGGPIRYSGGRHHMFLHCREHLVVELTGVLKRDLMGVAEIMTLPELHALGFLGPSALSDPFKERLGNIGVLPYPGHSCFWHEPPSFMDDEPSGHGGITCSEMEVPLLIFPIA